MFRIDDRKIKGFEDDLKDFSDRALPYATRNTLNSAAFEAQRLARRDVDVKMISRNRFTKQSIQVDQSKSLSIQHQSSSVGSIAPYMEDQEFGGIKTKKGSEGVPIATTYSAGQGMQSRPRTRFPRKPNSLGAIQLRRRSRKGSNRKQKNIAAIRGAAGSGQKFVFLELGRKKGIFKIVGGKRRPQIRMVWDMTESSVVIPKNPWLKPAFDTAQVRIPEFYEKSIKFQINRLQLFK